MAKIHAASFESAPRPWTLVEITDLLESPNNFVFTEEGGFLMLRVTGPEAEILTLAVHPSRRREGIGRALLRQMFDFAFDNKIEEIFLEVSQINTAAKALYLDVGFIHCGERKDYYHDHNGNKITAQLMKFEVNAC